MKTTIDKMYESTLKFLLPLSLKETSIMIVKEATKLVNAEYGTLFLGQKNILHLQYSSAPSWSRLKPRPNGYTYKAFRSGKLFIFDEDTIRTVHPEFTNQKIKSVIIIPLYYRKRAVGVLSLQSKKKEYFTPEKTRALKLYGSMASLAVTKTKLYNEVKNSLHDRDLFISMAAHELKTPLTTIYAYAQVLEEGVNRKNPVIDAQWVRTLLKETVRLKSLIEELLQVDQIKTGKFQYIFKNWKLKDIIDQATVNFESSYPHHTLVVKTDLTKSDKVIGDYNKLMQVIINVLNNAAKFSSLTSPIHLHVERRKSYFFLQVKDKGQGIAKSDLGKVFREFYKGRDNEARGGRGLGLYLAKIILEEHKGTIEIDSSVGAGTTVEIKLPKLKTK